MEINGVKLKELRSKYNLSQEELSRFLGISVQTVQKWEQTNKIPKSRQLTISLFFKSFDRADSFKEPSSEYNKEAKKLEDLNIMMVPFISHRAHAGFSGGYGDPEYIETLPTVPWEVEREHKGNYFTYEVYGDSMISDKDPRESYYEYDELLVRELPRHHWYNKLHYKQYDFVIAHKENGTYLKRIIDHDLENGTITCHSLNSLYDDFVLHLSDVQGLFNVVKSKRSRRR